MFFFQDIYHLILNKYYFYLQKIFWTFLMTEHNFFLIFYISGDISKISLIPNLIGF